MEELNLILDDLEKTKELDLRIVDDYEIEDDIEILEDLDKKRKVLLSEEDINEESN